jgi:hypothetical protein
MMIFKNRLLVIFALFLLNCIVAKSQDKAIGFWESHLPYNVAVGVATDGKNLFTVCPQPFYTFDFSSGQLEPYSKVNGMSDIGMQCVGFDATTSTAVLAYTNGNIDLFKNNTFYNIPDLKIKSIAGNKSINNIYCENGIAYLSTSVGILVIDLTTHNIQETYQFILNNQNVPVNGFTGNGDKFYAITLYGLYSVSKNNPQLQNFAIWSRIDSTHICTYIASVNNTLFLANNKYLYSLVNDSVKLLYATQLGPIEVFTTHNSRDPKLNNVTSAIIETDDSTVIQHIDAGNNCLLISEFRPKRFNGDILVMDTGFHFIDSCVNIGNPQQAVQLPDNSIWIADAYYGLEKRSQAEVHKPGGPADASSFDIYAYNKNVWIVHGSFDDKLYPIYNVHDASNYSNGKWNFYERDIFAPFNNFVTPVAVLKDEKKGTVYIGSFLSGLFILNADGTNQIISANSIFDVSRAFGNAGQRQVIGLALDNSDNLYVTTSYSTHQLYVKTADSQWYKYLIPGITNAGPVTVDDNGVAWVVGYSNGGLAAYNTNGTFADISDDSYYHLTTGVGTGNLPSNNVHCIAKDKNNNIWVGTDNGIGIVSSCSFGSNLTAICDATIPIVQYDQFAGYLFAGNNVTTIAVDGANRKWVGTDDGVWLLSSDAQKIIYRFTRENSPLPSNLIQKISIDKITGDVYIGTEQGTVGYRSTATEGGPEAKNVLIFPNPVPKGFSGTIAIKGIAENSDVRITDINDQLVFKTKALGGQAVWNGKDYKGHRPQSGVYIVFASTADGTQTYAGKIVFIE